MNEQANNASFGHLSSQQVRQVSTDVNAGRQTSLGLASRNHNSLMMTAQEPQKDFHDERVKDAMTFNTVMKSVHNSTGFLGASKE